MKNFKKIVLLIGVFLFFIKAKKKKSTIVFDDEGTFEFDSPIKPAPLDIKDSFSPELYERQNDESYVVSQKKATVKTFVKKPKESTPLPNKKEVVNRLEIDKPFSKGVIHEFNELSINTNSLLI